MKASLGRAAAVRLLRAMRPYGVTGEVHNQTLRLGCGRTVHYTTAREWNNVMRQVDRVPASSSGVIFATQRSGKVRVLMDIETFAEVMAQLESLMAETGRVGDAFTE